MIFYIVYMLYEQAKKISLNWRNIAKEPVKPDKILWKNSEK